MTGPAPLIDLRAVTKIFTRGALKTPVLHGITLAIHAGEFIAIMGPSGSGKTTLMNLIGLLDRPTGGSYRFAGREVGALDADQRADLRCAAFGFIFQQYNLMANASAAENVEMPAIYAGVARASRLARARAMLRSLGLGERLDFRPTQLSGGQQQRVSIARALMNGGAVILADEPTGALDSKSGEEVMALLRRLNRDGHTVLIITHDAAVAHHADRVIEIRDGRIVADPGPAPRPAAGLAGAIGTAARRFLPLPDLLEAGRMALRALRANLLRTLLTLLGIIVGVASVITMLAVGDGAQRAVLAQLQTLGPDLMQVFPGAANLRRGSGATATLTPADAEAIAGLANVRYAVPQYTYGATARFGNRDYTTNIIATTPNYAPLQRWQVGSGTFFTDTDLRRYSPVVVLGQTVVGQLFPHGEDPVGRFVLVNAIPFKVIGVMAARGSSMFGFDQDDTMFVPLTTGMLRLFGDRFVRGITVQAIDTALIPETQAAIRQLLLRRHGVEDFQVNNMAAFMEAAAASQDALTTMLGSIALISLLVGGIGVMNIMLVSVSERTREIGVRMAAGARRFNILLQFNVEALAVCALGGLLGVALGLLAAWLFSLVGQPVVVSGGPIVLALGCALATGMAFGYLPARKAAGLDPVQALAAD